MTKQEMLQLKMTATRVRMGIIEATHGGKSGHPGGSLSAADVLTYLYFKEMQIDPQNPQDPDRDRFVLSNPGLLKLPVEQIYAGGESKARNQRMQHMLRMIGYGENLGSGFPLILSAWNEKHWLKPELVEQPELMQVKLILHIENRVYVTKDVTKDVTKELTERQQIILEFMQADGTITISEMSQKTNVTERTIKRDIESLTEKGILSREGGRKEGRWVIRKI